MRILLYNDLERQYNKINITSFLVNHKTSVSNYSIIMFVSKINLVKGLTDRILFSLDATIDTDQPHVMCSHQANIMSILRNINNLLYNVDYLNLENLPVVMKPVGIHKHIINCNDRRLVNNLYVSGWNISVNSIYMKSYKCNICNIKITGKLNEDPVLDHIAHNPFCAYVKLFSNLNHLYMGQTLIVYINIIVQLYFVISHLLIRYRNS